MLKQLTNAQNDVMDQIVWLDSHFKTVHGNECFSQSVFQLQMKLKLSRRTVQTAIRKLEELGLVSVAYNQGYGHANLFFVHLDKLEELRKESLDQCTNANEKVKNIFHRFLTDAFQGSKPDLSQPEQAKDFTAYCVDTFDPTYFEDEHAYTSLQILNEYLESNYDC